MSSIIRNALALSAVIAVAAAQAPKTDAPCADVVIVMARGNNAPYQDWRTFPFVDATCGKLRAEGKTCDFIEVVFETMMNGDFCTQIATGVRNGQAEITAFNKKCPCSHIILNGFSQGAWIAGDILAGPGGCSQITTGLDNTSAPGNAIAAALLWGDVMHVANQPYNVLDGADLQKDGRSADSLARLNRYSSVLRSYCAKGDPICTRGDDVSKHLNYFELYTDDASTWAVGKIHDAAPLCAAPAPTPSASSPVVAQSVASANATAPSSLNSFSNPLSTPTTLGTPSVTAKSGPPDHP
ncbi:alpha/beta-hydrolase [Pyrenochaeta sp. DS3sAY3a]|nr:alpha/beta-hydrolase [Pyrenochaeta sp. DS3sAY3a]